jgi:DNA-binding NarL/FixJ family response regulator
MNEPFSKDGLSKRISSSKDGVSKDGVSKDAISKKDLVLLLTAREKEVLHLLTDGCTNKEIAKRLKISVRTVETHRKNIMQKLSIKTLAGLIKFSIANNLILLE